jgi:hypothetical protein
VKEQADSRRGRTRAAPEEERWARSWKRGWRFGEKARTAPSGVVKRGTVSMMEREERPPAEAETRLAMRLRAVASSVDSKKGGRLPRRMAWREAE